MTNKEIVSMRYKGIAPDGFIIVSELTLDKLKDFDIWKLWRHDEVTLDDLEEYESDPLKS